MSREILAAELVGQQPHGPGGATHLLLLAGVVVTALVIFGVSRWRRRRDAAAADEQSTSYDRPAASTQATEEE